MAELQCRTRRHNGGKGGYYIGDFGLGLSSRQNARKYELRGKNPGMLYMALAFYP